MNPTDPLAQLKDIHLPEAISWWPLAFGWWVIGAICIFIIVIATGLILKHFFAQRYRRQALTQLKTLTNSAQHQRLMDLLTLLKQVASSAYPLQNFASLSHNEFIIFLQKSSPKMVFEALPEDWEQLLYAENTTVSSDLVDQLVVQSRYWIKSHFRAEKLEYNC